MVGYNSCRNAAGAKDGSGVEKSASGKPYIIGQWKNNKRHGHEVLTSASGVRLEGESEDGRLNGPGTAGNLDGEWYRVDTHS